MATTYRATVERDGRFWLVRVDGVGATQARHLRELEAMATDLVEVMTGAAPGSFTVEYDIELPESVRRHVDEADRLRQASAKARADAATEFREAARELRASGMPLRDIGQVLGISFQRAHQLVQRRPARFEPAPAEGGEHVALAGTGSMTPNRASHLD